MRALTSKMCQFTSTLHSSHRNHVNSSDSCPAYELCGTSQLTQLCMSKHGFVMENTESINSSTIEQYVLRQAQSYSVRIRIPFSAGST